MKKIPFVLSAFLFSASCFAATAGSPAANWRGGQLVQQILSDPRVAFQLNGGPSSWVSSIRRTGNTYMVTTPDCTVRVDVQLVAAPMPGGPESFILNVGRAMCLPGGSVGN